MTDQWIEGVVEKLVPGGDGLARIDGLTHFIPGSLPGERVRAQVVRRKNAWVRTGWPEILEPSPHRREPFCPLYRQCGGCSWQHIDDDYQLASKESFCWEALERQGGMTSDALPDILTFASPPRGYRARIRPFVLPDGMPGFREAGSDRVVRVPECPIATPAINRFLAKPPGALVPGSEPVVFGTEEHFRVDGIHKRAEATVGGREFRFPPGAFFQSNLTILDRLIQFAMPGDRPIGKSGSDTEDGVRSGTALDLYGGVGLFGAFLADRFDRVIGVDRDRNAESAWKRHVGECGEFQAMRLEKWLRQPNRGKIDYVVVDPPRGGLEPSVRQGLADMRSPAIAYVSCDPVTQARDLKELRTAGYRLEAYGVFDHYPQTPHVETVARLRLENMD